MELSEQGYVYVLFNPSLKGLVKIGRTARDSRRRAEELSSATGVATPFEVAFEAHFGDAVAAEQYVHATLTEKGFRRASNREFFEISLNDAVKAVVAAQGVLGSGTPQDSEAETGSSSADSPDDICDFAYALLVGEGDTLQDKERALTLYYTVAEAGSLRAALQLAEIWITGKATVHTGNLRRWLDKAAERGSAEAWGYLAILWRRDTHSDNARKCWDRLFKRFGELEDLDRVTWARRYAITTPVRDVTPSHREALVCIRDLVLQVGSGDGPIGKKLELVLFPEIDQPREFGRVVSVESGVVSIAGGYHVRKDDLPSDMQLSVGQQVEFIADSLAGTAVDVRHLQERIPPDWNLIEEIRQRLLQGGIDGEERATLLKRVREELQK